jgi:hypothetical protein
MCLTGCATATYSVLLLLLLLVHYQYMYSYHVAHSRGAAGAMSHSSYQVFRVMKAALVASMTIRSFSSARISAYSTTVHV